MNYFGIYRSKAVSNEDTSGQRRVKVVVPSVSASAQVWAMPCLAPGTTTLPNPGDGVWVMYEEGNVDYPVWIGTF